MNSKHIDLECPTCEQNVETTQVGTSPHIETGEPVPQHECNNCGAVSDIGEYQ